MPRPLIHIAFLHTAQTHVELIEDLMYEVAPTLRAAHFIREDLLIDAQQPSLGIENHHLVKNIKYAVKEAASSGARVVVCTCSTIGGVVESLRITVRKQTVTTARIDRAMADAAINTRKPILLVATLQSTLQPTTALLQSTATALGCQMQIKPLLISDAWALFQAGNFSGYIDSIVNSVISTNLTADLANHTIVLAQASMHKAVAPLAARGIVALSSPELGVRHAVALVKSQSDLTQ